MSETTTENQALRDCPFCMEKVNFSAKKCKHCGETLDVVLRVAEEAKRSSNNVIVSNNNNNNNNNTSAGIATGIVAVIPAGAPKSRIAYILLGFFFGLFGIHNFYAGYGGRGAVQLLLTLLMGWLLFPLIIVGTWVLIEIIVVNRDARGLPFS